MKSYRATGHEQRALRAETRADRVPSRDPRVFRAPSLWGSDPERRGFGVRPSLQMRTKTRGRRTGGDSNSPHGVIEKVLCMFDNVYGRDGRTTSRPGRSSTPARRADVEGRLAGCGRVQADDTD